MIYFEYSNCDSASAFFVFWGFFGSFDDCEISNPNSLAWQHKEANIAEEHCEGVCFAYNLI